MRETFFCHNSQKSVVCPTISQAEGLKFEASLFSNLCAKFDLKFTMGRDGKRCE